MNGPEHYREAERLLDLAYKEAVVDRAITREQAEEIKDRFEAKIGHAPIVITREVDVDLSGTLAAAQVHATLALAAATAADQATRYERRRARRAVSRMGGDRMTARTGWLIVYRCGCTDLRPTNTGFADTCPGHGTEPINRPELITDQKPDRDLDQDPWFGFRDDTDVVVERPVDADVCGRCEGQGQVILNDLYGPAWAICHSCGGSGVRRAVA